MEGTKRGHDTLSEHGSCRGRATRAHATLRSGGARWTERFAAPCTVFPRSPLSRCAHWKIVADVRKLRLCKASTGELPASLAELLPWTEKAAVPSRGTIMIRGSETSCCEGTQNWEFWESGTELWREEKVHEARIGDGREIHGGRRTINLSKTVGHK
eukprot:4760346-Pyramimonas_sp.AAC.1